MRTGADFYEYDYRGSLFPMATTRHLVTYGSTRLLEHSKNCLEGREGHGFSHQLTAYASKPELHLRRTQKLDPSAEYLLYDIVFRNRSCFLEPTSDHRKHFGYRFDRNGQPTSATESYGAFRKAQADYERKFNYSLSFDIASFFNSLRHDEIVAWCEFIKMKPEDVESLNVFLSQSNSGRSSDCWPQGIYPAKVIGNDLLRVSEGHPSLKAKAAIRFMDDFVFFANEKSDLVDDFFLIQKLIGTRGLSLNPSKTLFQDLRKQPPKEKISEVKAQLLSKRREAIQLAYTEDFDEAHHGLELEKEEIRFIRCLLESSDLSEEDAELVLSVSRACPDEIKPHLTRLATGYPHLAKGVWSICTALHEVDLVRNLLLEASRSQSIHEYQLFWLAQILADVAPSLISEGYDVSEISVNLYSHKNATDLSIAKVLEIDARSSGLMEFGRHHLTSGNSNWMVWASAIGHREIIQNTTARIFSSFSNASHMNKMISDVLKNPDDISGVDEAISF